MNKLLYLAAFLLLIPPSAKAWNCPSGQHRVQAPAGTPTNTPYYDVVEGIAFICESDTPPTTTPSSQTQSQNQSQNQTASSNSSSNSSSKSQSNSTSASGVNNSGNSSNTNTNTATGGAGGTANASSSNNATGSGNSTTISSNEQVNVPRQTPMAYSPDVLSTSPCTKGFSGGAAFPMGAGSLGVSKVDKGCDSRQTAVIFHGLGNDQAAAKILCSTDAAKRAKLTLNECLAIIRPSVPVIVAPAPAPAPVPAPPIIVTMPAPVVIQQTVPAPPAPKLTRKATKRVVTPCPAPQK